MKKYILLILTLIIPVLIFAQKAEIINVIILEDEKPLPETPPFYNKKLQDETISYFLKRNQSYKVVNRDFLDQVKTERDFHKEIKTEMLEEDIDVGGNYLVSSKFNSFKYSFEVKDAGNGQERMSAMERKQARERKPIPKDPRIQLKTIVYKIDAQINLTLISVETGEVIFEKQYSFSAGNSKTVEIVGEKIVKERYLQKEFNDIILEYHMHLDTELPVQFDQTYHIAKAIKEKRLNFVIITGGTKGGMPLNARLFVHEIVEEVLNGKKVRRDKVIGELIVKERYGDVSICKIIQKQKVVLESIAANKKLYCKLQFNEPDLREINMEKMMRN